MKFFTTLIACASVLSFVTATPLVEHGSKTVEGLGKEATASNQIRPIAKRFNLIDESLPAFRLIRNNSTLNVDLANNPFHIGVNINQDADITVIAHAAFFQHVTFSGLPSSVGTSIVFTGNGENVPMKTSSGAESVIIPAQTDGYEITVLLQFSTTATGPLQNAVINNEPTETPAGTTTIWSITSEDSTDSDDNDSVVTILINTLD